MLELLLGLAIVNLALSAGLFWYQSLRLKAEKARADRYAAAILHVSGEPGAARLVSPKTGTKSAPAQSEALRRPRQIGLSQR